MRQLTLFPLLLRPSFALTVLCIGLLLVTVPAFGQITALEVEPAKPCINRSATFKVIGNDGVCNGSLNFGDGTPSQTFGEIPFTTTHTYTTGGTFKAAAASTTCGNTTLQVTTRSCSFAPARNPGQIARQIERIPQIEAALTLGLKAGAGILLAGRGFGDDPGRVRIVGASGERELEIEKWSADAIAGKVPANINVICPTGAVIVEKASGAVSSPRQLPLAALADKMRLPYADIAVVACGSDGNHNRCNGPGEDGDFCFIRSLPPWYISFDDTGTALGGAGPSIVGEHGNCWGAIGDDSGVDTYNIVLKNGWFIESAQFLSSVPEGEGWTIPRSGTLPAGFVARSSTWTPSIQWSVSPNDEVLYNLYITIQGPVCTTHK